MTKVKLFGSSAIVKLEAQINEFLNTINQPIADIKLVTEFDNEGSTYYTAMVIIKNE